MRAQLLDAKNPQRVNNRVQSNKRDNPTEMELAKMKQWEEADRKIDDRIDIINEGMKRWKDGVLKMGQLID